MLATAAVATAETGLSAPGFVVAPPYPPHPINNNNNNNGADPSDPFDPSEDDDFDCDDECCESGCGPIAEEVTEELPFTGAPVATVAALGGGLLAAGAAATLISVRRRRSSSGA